MPRIALLTSTFPEYDKCPVAQVSGHLAEALVQQGHDVHVITSALPEILGGYKKVSVHKTMTRWSPLQLGALVQTLLSIKPEILHVLTPTILDRGSRGLLFPFVPEIGRLLGRIPTITSVLTQDENRKAETLRILPLALQSHRVTVPNQSLKKFLDVFIREPSKVRVVGLGAFNSSIKGESDSQRPNWDLNDTDFVVAYEGSVRGRAFSNFFESIVPLLKTRDRFKILFLNPWKNLSPNERLRITEDFDRQGVLEKLIFAGSLGKEALNQTRLCADLIVAIPRRPIQDGVPSQLREILRSRLPCMTWSRDLKFSELGLKHGSNIWLSDFENVESLRSDFEMFFHSPETLEKISEETSTLRFDMDVVSNEMSRLYAELLSTDLIQNFA